MYLRLEVIQAKYSYVFAGFVCDLIGPNPAHSLLIAISGLRGIVAYPEDGR